jgi:methionine--tRNA ligase beta chain
MARVAFLCGKVLEVQPHPDSDKLFVEQIDLGEPEPRTIISGLRDFITVEEFTGRNVVVVANLEPRKMRGIPSAGMVLCASTEGKGDVKLLDVPEGVAPGERITFPGHEGEAEPVLKKKLAKHYDDVAPLLRTNSEGVACFGDLPFVTSKGPVVAPIKDGGVS